MEGYQGFCHPSEKIGKNGTMRFTAYGYELHQYLDEELPRVLKKLSLQKSKLDIVFSHASSKIAWHHYGEKAGIANKMFHIYPDTGNLVSASIPAAISLAKNSGKLARGNNVLCWVGSAGMSFSTIHFKF